ncbi:MAG: DUF393 domain-containing protein [Myxococcales bacterium]|nr:DUF393 domain-containing protein [Myxococcales bacterium]
MAERPFRSRWYGGFAWLVSADPRAVALFRIAFGIMCIWDVLRRIPWIELFFTNNGVIPNHFSLFRPHATYTMSLLQAFKTPGEVGVFFALTVLFLVCFTIGYRTRLFHVLSAVAMLSIHNRTIVTENGGDVVANLWWLWTFFLPMGARYSVDALRASLRGEVEKSSAALNAPVARTTTPIWHLGVLAVVLQLAVIYFFNTIHKSGAAWRDGTALAWVLDQDRVIRDTALWLREVAPLWVFKALAWGTLVVEGGGTLLLLSPVFTTWCRRIAIVGLVGLHFGIFALMDLGLFSQTMMVSYLLLLTPPDFALGARLLRRLAGPPVRVFYDSDCGICHLTARVLRRLDVLGLITWVGREEAVEPPAGWSADDLAARREDTLIATDGQRTWTESGAVWRTLRALPLLRPVVWPMRLPGVRHALDAAYRAFAGRRHRVSAWIGLGECGLGLEHAVAIAPPAPSSARRLTRRIGFVASNAVIVFGLAATGSQALIENQFLSRRIKHHQPKWAQQFIQYGRFFQGWSMFAPDVPKTDGHIVMDVELTDGRRLDPQTGVAPLLAAADARRFQPGFFWGVFSSRLPSGRNAQYRTFFSEWLRRPTQRLTLTPKDRIKRFKIWWVADATADPTKGGEPKIIEKTLVMQWPEGNWDFTPPLKESPRVPLDEPVKM